MSQNVKKESNASQQQQQAPKRTFVPNLNVKREKKETIEDKNKQTEDKTKQRQQRNFVPNLNKSSNAKRQSSNVIQSHSIFETGPAESSSTSLNKKYSTTNDNHMSGSFDRVIGSTLNKASNNGSLDDKKFKTEILDDNDDLLIRDLKLDEDETSVFVKLPQVNDKEFKHKKEIPTTTTSIFRLDEFFLQQQNNNDDLDNNPNLVYTQLPDILDHNRLNENEGKLGKIKIHKSGKIYLHLNNGNNEDDNNSIKLEIRPATDAAFLQDLVSINTNDTNTNYMANIGHIKHKILGIPIID